MALNAVLTEITFPSSGDLSAGQHKLIKIASDGQVELCGAGENSIGVLQNDPAAENRPAVVAVAGVSKVILGATVAVGAKIMSDASARAITATATNHVLGVCVLGGAVNEIGEVLLQTPGSILA